MLAFSLDVAATLIESVDESLLIPGESVRTATYERIQRSYQLRRESISEEFHTFHHALHDLLCAGSKVVEKIIIKNYVVLSD